MEKLTRFQTKQRGKIEKNWRIIRWVLNHCPSRVGLKDNDTCFTQSDCLDCWGSALRQLEKEEEKKLEW